MKTYKKETEDFLEALLWAYPENEDGENPFSECSIHEFSEEFADGVESFINGFYTFLDARGIGVEYIQRSFGGNCYLSLSEHGCGFFDDTETEYLQKCIEEYSGNKYRFEEIDLQIDDKGEITLGFLPEYISKGIEHLFGGTNQ